jgi:hypothetical protein
VYDAILRWPTRKKANAQNAQYGTYTRPLSEIHQISSAKQDDKNQFFFAD